MHMNRYTAFATHLAISATVVGWFFMLVCFIWYPAPYFSIEGTNTVLVILIGVDIVLGPLLTLIVFKPGKPSLKFDLSIIALIQVSALVYGAQTIYTERPYFVAFSVNKFIIVQAADAQKLDLSGLDTRIDYHHPGPTYVYAEVPTDPNEKFRLIQEVIEGGPDIDRRPSQYRDFKSHISRSFDRSLDLDVLAGQFPGNRAIIDAFRARYPDTNVLAFYPLIGKNRDIVLVLNRNSAEIIDYIDLDPYQKFELTAPGT